jgi:triosephosphate isomerase
MLDLAEGIHASSVAHASFETRMRPLIAGNWKMHGEPLQFVMIEALAVSVKAMQAYADVLICLPR